MGRPYSDGLAVCDWTGGSGSFDRSRYRSAFFGQCEAVSDWFGVFGGGGTLDYSDGTGLTSLALKQGMASAVTAQVTAAVMAGKLPPAQSKAYAQKLLEQLSSHSLEVYSVQLGEIIDYFPVILNDIIYIETDSIGRKIIIHTPSRTIESYTPLKEIAKELDRRFFQCHRAIIVNTEKILKIHTERSNAHLDLSGGNICPLSLRKVKELMAIVGRNI